MTAATRRWLWLAVWLAIAAVLAWRATARPEKRGVLLDHLEFGRRLAHGEDVYAPWHVGLEDPLLPLHPPYPPSFGLLTAPFAAIHAWVGLPAARFAWALLQIAALAVCGLVLRELAAPRAPPAAPADAQRWQWLWLVTFVLLARFVLRDTHGGGGNLINVALALLAFRDGERGREARAGCWLALSLVTKPNLVWLVPVLALFGRRRTLVCTAAAGALLVLATLALQRFDAAPWWRWLQGSWLLATQADPWAVPALDFPPFTWMNQALRFAVARWCGEVPPEFAKLVPWGVAPGLGLSTAAVAWLVRGVSALLLAATLAAACCARRTASGRTWVVAATLVLTLLLSPISWKGHHVALLPVVLLLVHRAATVRARGAVALLAAWFLVCALPGQGLVGDAADEWLNSVYVVTFGDVALLLTALALACSARELPDAGSPRGHEADQAGRARAAESP